MTDKQIRDEAMRQVMGQVGHTNNGVTRYIADAVASQVVRDEHGDPGWICATAQLPDHILDVEVTLEGEEHFVTWHDYEIGREYLVSTKYIKVPTSYKIIKIGYDKWIHKLNYWKRTGEFESSILVDKDFRLVDGFSSVKIAYLNGVDKVLVRFVD